MQTKFRFRAWFAAALCLLATSMLSAPSAWAGYHPSSQEQQDIAKLISDFQAIKAGSQVTDAEKQAIAADLQLLATSTTKPSTASVTQLADDLSAAFADGSLSITEKAQLVLDVDAVFNSAGLTTDEASQFISDAQAILASSGINAADVKLIAGDLVAITADAQSDFISTNAVFALTPPTAGTVLSSAQLTSTLGADGTTTAHLALEVLGLNPGTYTVNATTAANGTPVSLGSLKIIGFKGLPGLGAAITVGTVVFGDANHAFPAGFDAAALASVTVTDATGAVQLSGSVAEAGKLIRIGNLRLVPAAAYPNVVGDVAFEASTRHSKVQKSFLLFARMLPASAPLTIKVNGAAVGLVTTDAKGRLLISEGSVALPVKANGVKLLLNPVALPAGVDLTTLSTVELDDAQGQVVATAGLE